MTKRILLLFFLVASTTIWSQSGTGSPYSFGGLGEINYKGNHWSRAMGGLEFYTDSIHVDFNNPASLSTLKVTNFSLGIDYKVTNLEDNSNSQSISTSALNYMGVNIPTKYFGFNFGLLPYSSVGYRMEYRDAQEEATEIQRYDGSGGLNLAFLSVGFNLFQWWSLGASAQYGFGDITHRSSQLIENVDRTTFLESNSSLSGLRYKFSSVLRFPLGLKSVHFYTSYTPEAKINSKNNELFTTLSTSTSSVGQQLLVDLSLTGLDETLMIVPRKLTIGFGIGENKKWFVGGQYETSNNSNFRNDFITLDGLSYEDGNKLALGGFFIPSYGSLTDYWKRIVYRFGFFNETTGIQVRGSSLTDSGITFGVGLPALRLGSFSNANLGVTLGSRTTSNSNLIKENYWQLSLGFSLNDVWFIKRKYN